MNDGRAVWRLALRPEVVRRALMFAVVIGTILIAINQGDAILRGVRRKTGE